MGKSTINGNFPWQNVSSPEGNIFSKPWVQDADPSVRRGSRSHRATSLHLSITWPMFSIACWKGVSLGHGSWIWPVTFQSLGYPLSIPWVLSHNQQPLTAEDLQNDLFCWSYIIHQSSIHHPYIYIIYIYIYIYQPCFSKMGNPPEAPKKKSSIPPLSIADISTQDVRPRGSQLQLESFERNSLGQTAPEASAQAGKIWEVRRFTGKRPRDASNLRKPMEIRRKMGCSHG